MAGGSMMRLHHAGSGEEKEGTPIMPHAGQRLTPGAAPGRLAGLSVPSPLTRFGSKPPSHTSAAGFLAATPHPKCSVPTRDRGFLSPDFPPHIHTTRHLEVSSVAFGSSNTFAGDPIFRKQKNAGAPRRA